MTTAIAEEKQRMAQLLGEVHDRQRKYEMFVEPPAPAERIEPLRSAARVELSIDLPAEYAAFLELSDGLDWNGAVIYATERKAEAPGRPFLEGLVPANLDLRDNPDLGRLLVLGESGMELYVHDPQSGAFRIIDRVSMDPYDTFDSFGDLLAAILRSRL